MIKQLRILLVNKLIGGRCMVFRFICLFTSMMCSLAHGLDSPLTSYPFSSPFFEKIAHDNNIVNDIVTTGLETKNGIIWLGTQNGLVAFDGYQFTSYTHVPNDKHSIPGDFVIGLGEQTNGDIWVATRSAGLAKFDVTSRKFTTYNNKQQELSITSNTLRALFVAHDDSLWIGSDSGVDHLSNEGILIKNYQLPNNLKGITYTIFEDKDKTIYAGGTYGVAKLQGSSLVIVNELSHLNVRGFVIDRDDIFWLSTHKGIYLWDGAQNLTVPKGVEPKLNQAYFRRIVITETGQVWGATYGSGLWLFDEETKSLQRKFINDPSDMTSLAFNDIGSIFSDSRGNLWIGMWGGGLQRLNVAASSNFAAIRSSVKNTNSLSFSNIRSFLELENGHWLVGSSGSGIDIIDPKIGRVGNISNDQTGESLSYVVALAQDNEGKVWAGSQTNGLYLLDLENKKAEKIQIDGLLAQSIFRLLRLKNGEIAVGTSKEVCILNTSTRNCKTVLLENGQPLLDSTTNLIEDSYGNLWVGSHKGLFRKKENEYNFLELSTSNSGLDNNYIHGIVEQQTRLLTVTPTGLNEVRNYNSSSPIVESISNQFQFGDGRPGGNMLLDSKGRLWGATSLLDFDSKILHLIGTDEGIDVGTLWLGSYLKLRNGDFLFGGTKGVLVARAHSYQPKAKSALVIIRNMVVNGQKTAIPKNNELVLPPGKSNISFQVAAIDPINRKQIRYKYRIKELSENWQELDENSRWIGLTNLDPIEHNIEVSASYLDMRGEIITLNLKVVVQPTFTQTITFKLFVALVLILFLYLFYKLRVRHLKWQAQQLEELVNQKSNELITINNIGKEFTTHLSLNEVFEEIYSQINAILTADSFGIGIIDFEKDELIYEYAIEAGVRFNPYTRSLNQPEQLAVHCALTCNSVLINDYDLEYKKFSLSKDNSRQLLINGVHSKNVKSMIYVPITIQGRSFGVIGLQSFNAFEYTEEDVTIIETLASYAAVALNNARSHEELVTLHLKLEKSLDTLKKTQDKLIMQEKMASLGQLVAGVAHEVNTPLGVAITAISVMEEKLLVLSNQVELNQLKKSDLVEFLSSSKSGLELVLPNLQRTANLVQQFKRVAANNVNNSLELVKLPSLYSDIISVLNNTRKSKAKIQLITHEITSFYSHPSQIIQVITIIIENALEHAFSGVKDPIVQISYFEQENHIVTIIKDNGIGIPSDVLEKIFEPFYTTKRKEGATGLGLSIAFNTVALELKGSLTCTSTPSMGAEFTLKLPKNRQS